MPMQTLFAASLLAGASFAAVAAPATAPAAPSPATVVAIRYELDESSAERIEELVVDPIERSLRELPRVQAMRTTATHRLATAELSFDGGAGEPDLAEVVARLDRLRLDAGIAVQARSVGLRPCRLACSGENPSL
ncbi:efflux RND transporter permease subunit [Massilia norwichensis]|uniref:Efflux RND transporter permease subunit n=1 Tax=Massilia norwichensis TaxID=1442366 RepID=A0ABT2A9V6_9BURK|nr:efflux RND transporter permease subunit [Massilia norwichensis]MCS0590947.1 efflux RND transporter permease subunit [Massilia norwichensis]